MKHFLFAFSLTIILFSCGGGNEEISTDLINNPNSANGEPSSMPKMKFEEESFDFGDISEGEIVEHKFKFKNTGDANLIISSAVGSCGCTVPTYPKEPIAPGEESEIVVQFNSNGKPGAQHKRVNIVANTNPHKTMIAIMANVISPENEEE